MKTISEQVCFGGLQGIYEHPSSETQTSMRFSVFQPPAALNAKTPVLWYLSGLTCTEENFTVKAGAQRRASELGLTLVAPDTSPRGADIEGENDSYDLGTGAGFYVDASESPWNKNYRMQSYITQELPEVIERHFSVDMARQGITGHSMGGHGALTLGLKNPNQYRSISAFSPICSPIHCPWGQKALTAYVGKEQEKWQEYDANALINAAYRSQNTILIDQGTKDEFLSEQLNPSLFLQSCLAAEQALTLRFQAGYDHSYYFIASFIDDHLEHHARLL